jgi:hypothetical protein
MSAVRTEDSVCKPLSPQASGQRSAAVQATWSQAVSAAKVSKAAAKAQEREGRGGEVRGDCVRRPAATAHHYRFRRYSPPTSYSARLICPKLATRTASMSAAKRFSP